MQEEDKAALTLLTVICAAIVIASLFAPRGPLCTADIFTNAGQQATCFEFWLNRYQTLVAGIIALVGAVLTVWAVFRQIDASAALERERREREHAAAKSVLALALSSLIDYCQGCIGYLRHVQGIIHMPNWYTTDEQPPAIPSGVTETLMQCIKYTSPERAGQINNLLSFVQIQYARITGLKEVNTSQHDIDGRLLDLVDLQVRTDRLFSYARSGDPTGAFAPSVDEVDTAIAILGLDRGQFESAMRLWALRKKARAH